MRNYEEIEEKTNLGNDDTILVNGNERTRMGRVKDYVKPAAATDDADGLMTAEDKKKLDGIAANANNYTLPDADENTVGGVKLSAKPAVVPDSRIYAVYNDTDGSIKVCVPWQNTTYRVVSTTADGLMTKEDKVKLDNLYPQIVDTENPANAGEVFNSYDPEDENANVASGVRSHAEGIKNKAMGSNAHAEGSGNIAQGNSSHAEGLNTTANAHISHTEGWYTVTSNQYEHAQGLWNVSNTGDTDAYKTIHSIGIGENNNRKNAQEVMVNGDHYIIGVGGYDGTNPSEAQTLQQVVQPKGGIYRPLYEAMGATYNEETGLYSLSGLDDLTEEQIVISFADSVNQIGDGNWYYRSKRVRTYFPTQFRQRISNSYVLCNLLESIQITMDKSVSPTSIVGFCMYNPKLHTILDTINVEFVTASIDIGANCPLLQNINLRKVHQNVVIDSSPVLSLDSVSYMVTYATNTAAITVQVHPDVYAKLTDSTNTEWYAVNTTAQAKNISFATTEATAANAVMLMSEPAMDTVTTGDVTELRAPAGYYITQADEPDMRMYYTRKVLVDSDSIDNYRLADTAEYEAWIEEKQEEINKYL